MVTWHGVEAELDPRPGGVWRVRHANGAVLAGEFVELAPPRLVVFTWGFEAQGGGEHSGGATPPGGSRVEVRLSEHEGVTRVSLLHTGFEPSDSADAGWRHFLPGLDRAR